MSQTTNSDSADALNDRLESVHSLLSDRDDGELSEEDASNLREHVERISEASFEEMFAAAGFDGDDLGPGDVPRLLSEGNSEEVQTLRQLLDVSKLGEDAPADDEELADQLDEILDDPGETAGDDAVDADDGDADDGEGADPGEADASEVDPTEADADTGGDESSDGGDEDETEEGETSDESGETDDDVTFADVFSGAASLAQDWSSSGDSAADEEDDTDAEETVDDADDDDVGDEEVADEEAAADEEDDDNLFDTEDIKERLTGDDEDESSDSDGKRRSRRRRFSTVPSRRSDMGKSPRFSTVKARK